MFGSFFYIIKQFSGSFSTVAKQIFAHINVASVCLVILVKVKLIKQSRFVLIKHVPADTGIIRNQHAAFHQHLIYGCIAKGEHMNPIAGCMEGFKVTLEFGMQIKINLQVMLFQYFIEMRGVEKLHIVSEVRTVFECFI